MQQRDMKACVLWAIIFHEEKLGQMLGFPSNEVIPHVYHDVPSWKEGPMP